MYLELTLKMAENHITEYPTAFLVRIERRHSAPAQQIPTVTDVAAAS